MATVTIGCKVSNGLILRLHKEVAPYADGDRKVARWEALGGAIRINGNGNAANTPVTVNPAAFASTIVDADFWKLWIEQNSDSDLLSKGLLFVIGSDPDAEAPVNTEDMAVVGTSRF